MQTTQYTTIKQKGTLVMAAVAHQQCPPTNQHQTLNLAPNLTNKILPQTSQQEVTSANENNANTHTLPALVARRRCSW